VIELGRERWGFSQAQTALLVSRAFRRSWGHPAGAFHRILTAGWRKWSPARKAGTGRSKARNFSHRCTQMILGPIQSVISDHSGRKSNAPPVAKHDRSDPVGLAEIVRSVP